MASRSPRTDVYLRYVGANVRRLRVAKGLTQEELAEAAEIAPRFLQRVERGRTNLGVVVIVALADALGVLPGALFRKAKLPEAKRGRPRKTTRRTTKP